jgi:hypothetical protein
MDLIDDKLSEPIKRQGYLDLYNGVDILQTRHYIKLTVKTFVEKAFSKHIATWMKTSYLTPNRSTMTGSRSLTPPSETQTPKPKPPSNDKCKSRTALALANSYGR